MGSYPPQKLPSKGQPRMQTEYCDGTSKGTPKKRSRPHAPRIVPPGSRVARFGGLLDDEVVLDVLHIGNGRSIFACCGLLARSVHEAAELNDSLVRLDFDLE